MSFSVPIHPPYRLETLSLRDPEAHHFWLTWSATECSGPAYCCPHCGGLQAHVACAQRFIHVLSLKPSSPQACRASSLVREPAHPLQAQSRGCPIFIFARVGHSGRYTASYSRTHESETRRERLGLFPVVLRFQLLRKDYVLYSDSRLRFEGCLSKGPKTRASHSSVAFISNAADSALRSPTYLRLYAMVREVTSLCYYI